MDQLYLQFAAEARAILDFWTRRMVDHDNGGFYGRIDGYGRLEPAANKGVILNTRILWSFAAAGRYLGDESYSLTARRAYDYLLGHFLDRENGGLYWMLDCRGRPVETKKQIYAQAFGIYALAEYNRMTNDRAPLEQAVALFRNIEAHSYDPVAGGYFEAFNREWGDLDDLRLSDKDANEKKTMNTHLHVLEAYTNLLRVWPDPVLRERLAALVRLFLERFPDHRTGHLILFFDEHWRPRSRIVSYGHDIEASWLLCEAVEVLGDAGLMAQVRDATLRTAAVTLSKGVDADGGLFNEGEPEGITDDTKDWWPQAEAMVGFYNAYQISGEARFQEAALRSWSFIQNFLLDRDHGEWLWGVARDGRPRREEDKAGPWKAPYHNTRACLEMVGRVSRGLFSPRG